MITTHLRNLLTAVICIFAGATAQAQFTGTAEQYPTTDYSASPISFELSAVAAALDTDAATLGAALTEYIEAESPATPLFFVQQPDGTESSDPTADANGFWMDAEGANVGYGDNSVFYASPDVDVDGNTFAFYVGQMPGVMEPEQKASATIKLKYNGKEVSFAISLNVIAKPVYDIPEPATLKEAELNIVGSAETTIEQFPRSGWNSDVVTLQIGDAVEKLGLQSGEMLTNVLGDILYCTEYNEGAVEDGGGLKKDSVTNESSANAPGFWTRAVMNENGEITNECCRATYSDDDYFFIESFAYDAESGEITCRVGQRPDKLSPNESYFVNCYLIYGDKAYRLHYNLNILERDGLTLEDITKVGEEDIDLKATVAQEYSETKSFSLDLEKIAAAIECNVEDLTVQVIDSEGLLTGESSASNQGFWLTPEGVKKGWQQGARGWYIENPTANDLSKWNVGQEPKTLIVGDVCTATLYFVNDNTLNYYGVNVTLTIVDDGEIEVDPQDWEIVAKRTAVIQAIPNTTYATEFTPYSFPVEDFETILGTSNPEIYALNNDAEVEKTHEKYGIWSKWPCDPRPGIWYNAQGQGQGWGSQASVGISFSLSDGSVTIFQMENANLRNVGDVIKAPMFFLNPETEKMLELDFVIQFVESLQVFEEVGSANLVLPVSTDEYTIAIDLAPAAEALGVTVDDILNEDNYYLHGMNIDGLYVSDEEGLGNNAVNGLAFNYDGGYDPNGSIFFIMEKSSAGSDIIIAANDDVEDDFSADGAFCIRVGEKQYVYNLRFVSPAIYTGIKNVGNEAKADSRIFDLSGRQVTKPVRGLYIQNGKKIVVK